ncbi:MAG TPA: ribosome maturation factor RimM [Microvirga sp.]|nr:ribosome maturation factor RimM [Microvirga sp.]
MKRGRSGSAPLSPSRARVPPKGAGEGPSSSRRAPSPAEGKGFVLLGEFGRAHGLRGEVRLKSYTADPAAIVSYGPLLASTGRELSLKSVRAAPGGAPDLLIAVVEGIASREAAEALSRVQLHIAREKLPPAEDEDEFLLADLIGLPVERPDGTAVGTIVAVPNYGGGDLLDIAPAGGGPTALLPFTKAFVPVVDIAGRRVVANPPDDLFDPGRPEPEDAP